MSIVRVPRSSPSPKQPVAPSAPAVGGAGEQKIAFLAYAMLWTLVVYSAVPSDIFSADKLMFGAPNPVYKAIKIGLLLLGLIICFSRFAELKRFLQHVNRFFLLFLILVPLSYLWSVSRPDTMGRFMSIVMVVSVGLAFCLQSWNFRQFTRVLRPVVTLLVVGSLLFVLISPELAITQDENVTSTLNNAWHGLLVQKNSLGQLCVFGIVLWMHAWLSKEVSPWTALVFGGATAVCVILSRSSTSLLASVMVTLFIMVSRIPKGLRRFVPYIVGVFAVTTVAYSLAVLNLIPGLGILFKPVAMITGKDTSFSARAQIWEIMKENISRHPLFGSGYGGYWIGPFPESPSYEFLVRMNFYPTEGHNGYLEIVNDLGYLGLVCLLGYMFVFIRQSLRLMKFDRSEGALYLSLFFAQAIGNLSESTWLQVNSAFVFAIMTVATFSLGRSLQQYETQAVGQSAARPIAPISFAGARGSRSRMR
jgi:O-antigen ligase